MSGAQWSPERLIGMADAIHPEGMSPERVWSLLKGDDAVFTADALRAFARVVSVLGDKRLRVAAISPFGWEARIGNIKGSGADPLTAVLSLSDARDAGNDDWPEHREPGR